MKTIITIILNLLIVSMTLGQNIHKLDQKNGFKDFAIGDTYSKWQNDVNFQGTWEDGTKAYVYNGYCCQKIFDYNVEEIILRFYKNKLIGIYITTEKFQKDYQTSGKYTEWRSEDFEIINSSFIQLFGEPTTVDTSDNNGQVTYIWTGQKVILFSKYEYLGYREGDRQEIIIADLTYLNKNIENGF